MKIGRYPVFLMNGGVVACVVLTIQHLASRLIGDGPGVYWISIALSQPAGISLSYFLQKAVTFSDKKIERNVEWRRFTIFSLISLLASFSALLLAYLFRYGFRLDQVFGAYAGTASFGLAVIVASIANFLAVSKLVFGQK